MGDMSIKGGQNWMNEAIQQIKKPGAPEKPGKLEGHSHGHNHEFSFEQKPPVHEGHSSIGRAINFIKLENINPIKEIDHIRNAKGTTRDQALLGFRDKVDQMDTHDLREARDYIGKLMADPTNDDDAFLNSLLKEVNRELDTRNGGRPIFKQPDFRPEPLSPHKKTIEFPNINGNGLGRVLD